MEIKNVYLKNKMKIGVIGISGKGKSTLLNHLIDKNVANNLNGLIGSKNKEKEMSGETKNPVRYCINRNLKNYSCFVSQWIEDEEIVKSFEVELDQVAKYAKSLEKCTVTLNVNPSVDFEKIMIQFDLTELEFIDTQGLLDSLEEEIHVPLEIKECAVLLYLYDSSDQGNRGDYIKKYRNFLNSISEKPLIFLETSTQWQITKKDTLNFLNCADEQLNNLDENYSTPANEIRERYSILTNNDAYKNNDTFILTSILSASKSSVNFYEVKLPPGKDELFDDCVRVCATHTMHQVFKRLAGIRDSLQDEFNKAKGAFNYATAFNACYDLLDDIFVKQYQRIDYNSYAKILRYARHDFERFKEALVALQNGELFNIDLSKRNYEIHTPYGYHCIYETYNNQDVLDCMQLLLDLYKGYLARISVAGNKLSKAVQVYLSQSVSSDFMCRDTGYDIPILKEETFVYCMTELKDWINEIPVERVIYQKYDEFDVDYYNKDFIVKVSGNYVGSTKSLNSKLVYLCMCINNRMYNLATDNILNKTKEFIEL